MTEQNTSVVQASPETSVMVRMAGKFGVTTMALHNMILKTVMPTGSNRPPATQEEIGAFLLVADHYNLDPFRKQIFAFPAKGGGITALVGVDGWTAILNSQPTFQGMEFEYLFGESENDSAPVEGGTVFIGMRGTFHRSDRMHPLVITEWLVECQTNSEPWRKSPRRQLRHKLISQGARILYNISGLGDLDDDNAIRDIPHVERDPLSEKQGVDGLKARLAATSGDNGAAAKTAARQAEVVDAAPENPVNDAGEDVKEALLEKVTADIEAAHKAGIVGGNEAKNSFDPDSHLHRAFQLGQQGAPLDYRAAAIAAVGS